MPLAAGGIVQGLKLQHPDVAFTAIAQGTLPFLRASTTGDLLIALGNLIFLANLAALVLQYYRARAVSAWVVPTNEELMIARHTLALVAGEQRPDPAR